MVASPAPTDRDLLPTAPHHSDTSSSPSEAEGEPDQAPLSPTSTHPKADAGSSHVTTPEVPYLPVAPPAPLPPTPHNVFPAVHQAMPSSLGITFQGPPPVLPNGNGPSAPLDWQVASPFPMVNSYTPYPSLPPVNYQDQASPGIDQTAIPRPHPFIVSSWPSTDPFAYKS